MCAVSLPSETNLEQDRNIFWKEQNPKSFPETDFQKRSNLFSLQQQGLPVMQAPQPHTFRRAANEFFLSLLERQKAFKAQAIF
jgi:hypothetical protein